MSGKPVGRGAGEAARTSSSSRVRTLRRWLASLDGALVCFSGGVDSSYLLAEATRALGPRAVAFTALSASLDPDEAAAAARIADAVGAAHVAVQTEELDDARYRKNPVDRCYFCKTEVYGVAVREARARGLGHVLDGFNRDDRGDHRPGRRAARELGVESPLDALGFGKAEIRAAARALGLGVWDKPALACLSSRFPFGTEVTVERLTRVGRAERAVRGLGYRVVRVRYLGARARVELGPSELGALDDPAARGAIEAAVLGAGFERVELDPRGYRRGGGHTA